jgi:catechol 2,3-dioxygenase-like lactoylglutathione lyase family enzyme
MEVLSSRVLLVPNDFDATLRWYVDVLGLQIYREYGIDGAMTGVVLFLGGGFLELHRGDRTSGRSSAPSALWLQVPDVDAEHERLLATGRAAISDPPATMPWGLREMWLEDPDGTRIVLVEVPHGHPLRTRFEV